ncbi:MAG: Ig-like domain-containing protein [Actinomycetota bacterium]
MRTRTTPLLLALLVALSLVPPPAAAKAPRVQKSLPGQVKILTINARQNAVLGVKRFEDMFELARAVRRRPKAWDGGSNGAVTAPDVVLLQEMRPSNAEILEHILRQRFSIRYQFSGAEDAASQTLYNPETVQLVAEPELWPDVCLGDKASGDRQGRFYQASRFVDTATNTPFTVAAIHMPKNSSPSTETDCYQRNIERFREELAVDPGPVFIGGDFNKRAVETPHECDPNEISTPMPWYSSLITPLDGGRVYTDAVKTDRRARNLSLQNQWTHEQKISSTTCNGSSHFRRTRIDYLFSSGATVAEARTDHPGWAGPLPGTKREGFHKYSDHRFVWGRFILGEFPRVSRPSATRARGGMINLSWDPVADATSYVVYRAIGKRGYDQLARVTPDITTFSDNSTKHGTTYRYVIVPVFATGAYGLESLRAQETADSRGPSVVSVTPRPSSTGVGRGVNIEIRFSENVASASVTADRVRLYRGSKRLSGTLRQVAPRVLVFNPSFPMRKLATHRAEVKPVRDGLGNVGGGYGWKFTTGRF